MGKESPENNSSPPPTPPKKKIISNINEKINQLSIVEPKV
jgi:hypothetical protein